MFIHKTNRGLCDRQLKQSKPTVYPVPTIYTPHLSRVCWPAQCNATKLRCYTFFKCN